MRPGKSGLLRGVRYALGVAVYERVDGSADLLGNPLRSRRLIGLIWDGGNVPAHLSPVWFCHNPPSAAGPVAQRTQKAREWNGLK
jgi:hypothetical protein